MQSLNNTSNVPLRGSAIYIGSWDDILKYQNIQVTLNADSDCEITYYTSNDKLFIESTTFVYNSQYSLYFNSINSTSRYVYFTVRNLDNTNQSSFNFSVLYKLSPVSSGGGVSENVTIVGPLNGDGSVIVGGSVDANITNTSLDVNILNPVDSVDANITNTSLDVNILNPVDSVDANITNALLNVSDADTHTKLDTTNTNLTNTYNLLNTKGSSVLWNNVSSGVNGLSTAVNLSNIKISNMTFMGKSSGATLFTIQFSNDGVTYYDSQYSYNFSGAGSFGFNISGCPNYLKMKSSNDVVANAIINYC
jgi:hypothetical protein